jgi:hypothetical protein
MVDMAAIAGAASALKTAFDISKVALGLRDAALIRAKVTEMQGEISTALAGAIAAQTDQLAMLQRVNDLEKEVADLKAWEAEKQKYELKDVGHGAFAYVRKADAEPTEPPHWLCTNCYNSGKKSILLRTEKHMGFQNVLWSCPACSATLTINFAVSPRNSTPGKVTFPSV